MDLIKEGKQKIKELEGKSIQMLKESASDDSGKTKVFIKWSEIKEVGTGNIPTPFGSKQRIYFCDRVLDEKEKSDLIILKYHTVHFSYIPKECCEKISELLPVPMTEEMKEKYVR